MNGLALLHQLLLLFTSNQNRRVLATLLRRWRAKLSLCKFIYLVGMIGVTIIVLSILVTAVAFSGPDGTPYSVLNRKISTLGKPEFSGWAKLFNWGLQIGGLFLMAFIVGLGFYVSHRAMLLVTLAGIAMACGVVLVGMCPVTEPQCHRVAAQITFFGGAATTISFTTLLLLIRPERLEIWLGVPSGIASAAFIAFALILHTLYEHPQSVFISGPPGEERPVLWLPSLLEWLIFCTLITWVLTLAIFLYRQDRAGSP